MFFDKEQWQDIKESIKYFIKGPRFRVLVLDLIGILFFLLILLFIVSEKYNLYNYFSI